MEKTYRNTPKRIFQTAGNVFFITFNTKDRIPFFNLDWMAKLFILTLKIAQISIPYVLYAYKINPDHLHILIRPKVDKGITKLMQLVKGRFSFHVNKLLKGHENGLEDLLNRGGQGELSPDEIKKYLGIKHLKPYWDFLCTNPRLAQNVPPFKWHAHYHDRFVRDRIEFARFVDYIEKQWIKHNLPENKYCFIDRYQVDVALHGEREAKRRHPSNDAA